MCENKHQQFKNSLQKHGPFKIFFFVLAGLTFVALFAFLFGGLIQYLWNFTIASIFNIKEITYLQAVALVVLCRLLFGSFGHKNPMHSRFSDKMHEKFHHEKECTTPYKKFWECQGKETIQKLVDEPGENKKTT